MLAIKIRLHFMVLVFQLGSQDILPKQEKMAEWMRLEDYADTTASSESTITKTKRKCKEFWSRNSSIMLMILAQLISSLMSVAAKILQTSDKAYEALDTRQVCVRRVRLKLGQGN
jgi:hypothetical protein